MKDDLEATLKRMDELQIAFIAKLGEKIKELSRLISQLDDDLSVDSKLNRELLDKIHFLAHNLAGSAGTFKHIKVYNKAKAIESLVYELLEKPDNDTHNWYKFLQEFISSLRADVQISGRPSIVENFNLSINSEKSAEQLRCAGQHTIPNIIVVDDDELLLGLIKEQAKHFEYKVIPLLSTENLEEAIDKYQPAALLMDVVFPDAKHSGIEIINQLKQHNKIHCPVIFMSNRCDVEVRLDALRAGSDAFIVKPIEILELIRILDRLTQKLSKQESKILIVDDDIVSSEFYKLALEKENFVCESISDAMEVFNKALSFNPDAILLDINMPGCNGFEIAKVIRQDDNFTHIPILFLTSKNTFESEIEAMKSGGDDFLDKSSDFVSLIEIIKGHVQRYKELNSVLERLKKDEVRFRSVTNSTNDAIITIDAKKRIVFWNEGAESILGYHSLETIGQSLDIIIPPELRKAKNFCFQQLINNTSNKSQRCSVETLALKKDKKQVNVEVTYTEWQSGNDNFYTLIMRDISERKAIEHDLHHKEASLNAIVTSSGEGIVTIDSKGIIETANPKAAQIFGYEVSELEGQNVSILIPDREKKQHDEYVKHSDIHAPRVINQARDLQGQRKDGSLFALELNVSPMVVNGERKFVGILHDVSDRKLFVDQLLAAKEGAEAANKAKTQFLSNMSHELRTPLNAILGFTQILQTDIEEPPTTDQLDSLDHIYNAGMHLLALITEVLDLSKIESGYLELNIEKIDFPDFVYKTLVQLKPLAIEANIKLNNLINKDDKVIVEGDRVKLKQIINNLLSNAIKYNRPEGSVSVSLEMVGDNKICLSIADTGLGISAMSMRDLFKPFNRLGQEAGKIEGTGIGLTITKKLIEMMHGKIWVSSEEGVGTTFFVQFYCVDSTSPCNA